MDGLDFEIHAVTQMLSKKAAMPFKGVPGVKPFRSFPLRTANLHSHQRISLISRRLLF